MAIVSGDIGALTEMAEGQPPVAGRSLKRKKKPKPNKMLKGSVSDLTAALGQAGLQLPVECACDCSCDVEDVGPMVPTQPPAPSPPGGSEPAPSSPSPTAVNSEAPSPTTTASTTQSTTTTSTATTSTTTTATPGCGCGEAVRKTRITGGSE